MFIYQKLKYCSDDYIEVRDAVEDDLKEIRELVKATLMEQHKNGFQKYILFSWKLQVR